ncbi:lipase, partial [Corynebacterium tuscaniense]
MRNPVSRFSCWFTVVATAVVMTASAQPAGAQSSVDQLQGGLAHATSTPDKTLPKQYDPFYDDPVPAEQLDRPGKLLRAQPAPHLLNLLGPSFPGYAQRIVYTSTTVDGRIVPVSGYMIEPANPWQGAGPTPTVVFGPGTRGAGDGCAPSRGPWMMGQIDPAQPTVGT